MKSFIYAKRHVFSLIITVIFSLFPKQTHAAFTPNNTSSYINIINYDCDSGLLQLNIISKSLDGVFFVQSEGSIVKIDKISRDGIFLISLYIPNKLLEQGGYLIWSPFDGYPIKTNIKPKLCNISPRIIKKNNKCIVRVNNATTWSVASYLSRINGYTVYQNMYGLLLSNKKAFKENNLNKLSSKYLICPNKETLNSIKNNDVKKLFKDLVTPPKNKAMS